MNTLYRKLELHSRIILDGVQIVLRQLLWRNVLSTPEKYHWLNAMQKEMDSLKENDVWELVKLPEARKTVGSKWVFKTKMNVDGKIERYKARLVAQGFYQRFGSKYDETFCPVVRMESVRSLIAMSVQILWPATQLS